MMEVDDPAVYYAPAPQPTLPSPYHIALAAAAFSSRPPAAAATAIEGAKKKKEKKPRYRADAFLKARRQDKALKSRNPRQLRKRYKAAERGECVARLFVCVRACVCCVCCVCVWFTTSRACGPSLRACVAHHFARVARPSARVARPSARVAHPRRGRAWGRRGALLIVCLIGLFSEEGVVNARCARSRARWWTRCAAGRVGSGSWMEATLGRAGTSIDRGRNTRMY